MADGEGRFVFVHLKQKSDVTINQIEAKMNLSLNWYRFDARTWILYTTSTMNQLFERLRPFVNENSGETGLVICELNISTLQGWKPPEFWKWVRDPNSKGRGE